MWLKRAVLLAVLIPWDAAVIMQLVHGLIPSPEFMAIPVGLIAATSGSDLVTFRRRKADGHDDD